MPKSVHQLKLNLRIVFYKEGQRWVAHCLEMGLLGDGETKEAATDRLAHAILEQLKFSISHRNMDNLFMPAEPEYLKMFFAGQHTMHGKLILEVVKEDDKPHGPVILEDVETREYDDDLVMA